MPSTCGPNSGCKGNTCFPKSGGKRKTQRKRTMKRKTRKVRKSRRVPRKYKAKGGLNLGNQQDNQQQQGNQQPQQDTQPSPQYIAAREALATLLSSNQYPQEEQNIRNFLSSKLYELQSQGNTSENVTRNDEQLERIQDEEIFNLLREAIRNIRMLNGEEFEQELEQIINEFRLA